MNCRALSVDGLQLVFPGTGLALATAEWIRALSRQVELTVFLIKGVNLATFGLEEVDVRWVWIDPPAAKIDYVFRYLWGRKVTAESKALGMDGPHFIPFLYNYGRVRDNVVFIPDLVYRLFPDYGGRDPEKPWWNQRGRLPFRPAVRKIEEWMVARSGRLVTSTNFVRDHAVSALGVDPARITVVGHATPRWINGESVARSMPADLEALLPARFCLYVGGYAVRKNVPMLLRVCGSIFRQDPTFRCVFVGLGEERIQGNEEMSRIWRDDAVRNAVVCLPSVANDDLSGIYRRSSFSVYPSHSEGFGLPVVEAACCQRLCLCGDNSSMREIQVNPEFRIASTDEGAWMAKIMGFWQDSNKAMAAGRECQQAMAHFSWEASARAIVEAATR